MPSPRGNWGGGTLGASAVTSTDARPARRNLLTSSGSIAAFTPGTTCLPRRVWKRVSRLPCRVSLLPLLGVVFQCAAAGLVGIAAASAVFVWLVPGHPGRPTIAFADVEKAMQQVEMVSYDNHSKTLIYDAHGRLIPSTLQGFRQIWIRRTPPAIYEYDPILHIKHLEDTRGTLIYDEKLRKYTKAPFHDNRTYSLKYSSTLNRYVKVPFHHTFQMRVNEEMSFVTETPANSDFSNWVQQKTELNGIAFQKFTQTNPMTSSGTRLQSQTSIWVDVSTLRVIRLESEGKANWKDPGFNNRSNRYQLVEENIRYNETPPQGIFDWSPPPGAKVEGHWRKGITD